jgi:hypothetical protein
MSRPGGLEVALRITFRKLALALATGSAAVIAAGCSHKEPQPQPRPGPPERPVQVPLRERDEDKPMPSRLPPPPYNDAPLVSQRPPEQRAFVEAYEAVGRPRILVFVDRTSEGAAPANRGRDAFAEDAGPAGPGSLDYDAMENELADWLAADGRVEIIPAATARQRLSPEQIKVLQDGRPGAIEEAARQLDADVLVQVSSRRAGGGHELRLVAEAINATQGGQSIARTFVDVPPGGTGRLDTHTRLLTRKLMDGMTAAWRAMAEAGRAPQPRDGAGRDRPTGRDAGPTTRPPEPAGQR